MKGHYLEIWGLVDSSVLLFFLFLLQSLLFLCVREGRNKLSLYVMLWLFCCYRLWCITHSDEEIWDTYGKNLCGNLEEASCLCPFPKPTIIELKLFLNLYTIKLLDQLEFFLLSLLISTIISCSKSRHINILSITTLLSQNSLRIISGKGRKLH